MQARTYLPAYGKFAQVDPAYDQMKDDPETWNLYNYVTNNPVTHTDPDGRTSAEIADGGGTEPKKEEIKTDSIPDTEVKGAKSHFDPKDGTTTVTGKNGGSKTYAMPEATVQVGAVADRTMGIEKIWDAAKRLTVVDLALGVRDLVVAPLIPGFAITSDWKIRPRAWGGSRKKIKTVVRSGNITKGVKVGGYIITGTNLFNDLFLSDYTSEERYYALGYDALPLATGRFAPMGGAGLVMGVFSTSVELVYPGGSDALNADIGYGITGRY